MHNNLRWRLSLMMLLQYAASGAWSAIAGQYFGQLGKAHGFDGAAIGFLFSLQPLATIITPFGAGQMADRYINTERFLAALHIAGGCVMFVMAHYTEYRTIMPLMLVYALCYAPTGALTNSLTFAHIKDPSKQFGSIRVFGTIGWMIACYLLSAWRVMAGKPVSGDLFYLASALSIIMGVYCLTLPKTPPSKEGKDPLAFIGALKLFRDRDFTVFMLITFVASTSLDFHYIFGPAFLGTSISRGGLGVSQNMLPTVMSVAQISEVVVMLLMPVMLARLGYRNGVIVGMLAWSARYAAFAWHPALWLVVGSLAFHGLCVVFFFLIVFIYLDEIAPNDIRASAQSLAMLIVFGLGRFIGSQFAGAVKSHFTVTFGSTELTDWRSVFMVPMLLTLCCAIAFPLLCRERKRA